MLFKPLCFEYPDDEMCYETEDQLFMGDNIMLAPIYKQNATGRYVYLPEDMKMVRFRSFEDYDEEVMQKGIHFVRAELNELLVFVRKGKTLPLAKPANRTGDIDENDLTYIKY
jgi:alpha-glucosidase